MQNTVTTALFSNAFFTIDNSYTRRCTVWNAVSKGT